jgi:hypothetical protein
MYMLRTPLFWLLLDLRAWQRVIALRLGPKNPRKAPEKRIPSPKVMYFKL